MKRDNNVTSMAGEYLTAGKLFKMGLQVAVTVGNAKAIDIFAYNPKNEKKYTVQVKTSRKQNNFGFLKTENIKDNYIFVFIFLNEFKDNENNEEFFIVKGSEILKNPKKFFGQAYNSKNPSEKVTVNYKALTEYKDNWKEFEA